MTVGISPKVSTPALLLVAIGIVLVVLGVVLPDGDVRTIGLTAIGSGIAGFGAGYAASPGDVEPVAPIRSDDLLSPEAKQKLAHEE